MTKICCVCQKTKSKNGWTHAKKRYNTMLTHGYCPECFEEIMQRIRDIAFKPRSEERLNAGI